MQLTRTDTTCLHRPAEPCACAGVAGWRSRGGAPSQRRAGLQATHAPAALRHLLEAHARAALAPLQEGLRAGHRGESGQLSMHCRPARATLELGFSALKPLIALHRQVGGDITEKRQGRFATAQSMPQITGMHAGPNTVGCLY